MNRERLRDRLRRAATDTTTQPRPLAARNEAARDDRDIVRRVVRRNGMQLRYASERLKDVDSIVKLAVSDNPHAYRYASDRLKNDVNMGYHVYKNDPTRTMLRQYAGPALREQFAGMTPEEAYASYENRRKGAHSVREPLPIEEQERIMNEE